MQEERKKNNDLLAACCNFLYGFLLATQIIFQQPAHSADIDHSVSAFALVNTEKSQATYQVRRGDSLLTIAKRLKPADAHYYQVAVALWLKNPAAFTNNDLNRLKTNQRLLIPTTEEVHAYSLREASQAINSGILAVPETIRQARENYASPTSELKLYANAHEKTSPTSKITSELHSKPYILSALEQKLRDEVNIITNQARNLEQMIPTPLAQKQARMQHLKSLHDLQQKLITNHLEQKHANTSHEEKLSKLSNEQKRLQTELHEQQKAHNLLQTAVQKAAFLMPRKISYIAPKTESSFFKRIAVRKRWQQHGSPLLNKAEQLYCAADQKQASTVLNQLFDISAPGVGWPDEWLGQKPEQATLRSATLDILLASLHNNIERFPELAELTERVVLQWDYCDITGEGSGLYDLSLHKEQLTAVKARLPLLHDSIGFKNWGFSRSPEADARRYIPKLLEAREPYHAFEIFFHRIFREHCFPHPETGKVYTEIPTTERIISRDFSPPRQESYGDEYPHQWQPLCDIPDVNYQTRSSWSLVLPRQSKQRLLMTTNKLNEIKQKITKSQQEYSRQKKSMLLTNEAINQEMSVIQAKEKKRQTTLKQRRKKASELKTLAHNKKQQISRKVMQAQEKAAEERRAAEVSTTKRRELVIAIAERKAIKQAAIQRAMTDEANAILLQEFTAATTYLATLELKKRTIRKHNIAQQMAYAGIKGKKATGLAQHKKHKKRPQVPNNKITATHKKASPNNSNKQNNKDAAPSLTETHVKAKNIAIHNKGQSKQQTNNVVSMRVRLSHAPKVDFIKQQKPSAIDLRTKLSRVPEINFAQLNSPPNSKKVPPKQSKQLLNKNGEKDTLNQTPKTKKKLGITATALYTIPASGDKPFGKLSASWKPKTNWFVRGAAKYLKGEDFTYSWGVGYSDWRPGTTSVQLNNWGPIKSGEGLDIDDAIFSISHKVDAEFLHDNKLSLTLGVSKPISGDMAFNATFQWNPIKNWYFRTTASQKLKGGPTKWSYGFGYFDWRPGTWRVEYSNYEDNRYPFDNFREGAVTINRAWEF